MWLDFPGNPLHVTILLTPPNFQTCLIPGQKQHWCLHEKQAWIPSKALSPWCELQGSDLKAAKNVSSVCCNASCSWDNEQGLANAGIDSWANRGHHIREINNQKAQLREKSFRICTEKSHQLPKSPLIWKKWQILNMFLRLFFRTNHLISHYESLFQLVGEARKPLGNINWQSRKSAEMLF